MKSRFDTKIRRSRSGGVKTRYCRLKLHSSSSQTRPSIRRYAICCYYFLCRCLKSKLSYVRRSENCSTARNGHNRQTNRRSTGRGNMRRRWESSRGCRRKSEDWKRRSRSYRSLTLSLSTRRRNTLRRRSESF